MAANTIATSTKFALCDVEEKTIAEIITENSGRYVHFFGYGYYSEDESTGKPFRFLEYTWFIAKLEDVLKEGFLEFESEHQDEYKQYLTDCTEAECLRFYRTYDNGNEPKLIQSDLVDMNTPDGVYILL